MPAEAMIGARKRMPGLLLKDGRLRPPADPMIEDQEEAIVTVVVRGLQEPMLPLKEIAVAAVVRGQLEPMLPQEEVVLLAEEVANAPASK